MKIKFKISQIVEVNFKSDQPTQKEIMQVIQHLRDGDKEVWSSEGYDYNNKSKRNVVIVD